MSRYLDDDETIKFDPEGTNASDAAKPGKHNPQGDTTLSPLASAVTVFEPGTVLLEKFEIDELIGRGGMGSVYRVKHLLMNRTYALKCLNKYQTQDGGWRRFQNEAKAAQILDHANLIKVYEFGLLTSGQPYFLMELVDGTTLADEVTRVGHLPLRRALQIFIQVAFAIGYAHENRIIHRDLKPSNIMLVRNKVSGGEIVKVVDFGIAKLTGVDEFNQQTLTKTGEIFGSPLYMSPEQCMGTALDHRSDLYSLGCVFYEALTSAPPFLGESALATMMKHQGETQLSLKEASLGMQYPEELELIIAKLLEKDPNHRYQTGEALAKDLIRLESAFHNADASDPTASAADRASQNDTIYEGKGFKKSITQSEFQRRKFLNDPLSLSVAASMIFAAGVGSSYLMIKQTEATRNTQAQSASSSTAVVTKEQKKLADAYQKSIEVRDSWSTLVGDKRQFFFPINEDLGMIVLDTGEQIPARGQFSIPAKRSYGVIANKNLLNDISKLKKFENDDVAVFDFKGLTPPKGAYEIVSHFKNLRGLNVFSCEFYDEDLELFKNQVSLLSLNVGNTAVTGEALLKFPPLKNVNCLDISYMAAPQSLLPKIKEFPNLKQLMARKSEIRDEHIAMLADSNIKVASLAWNHKLSKNFAQILSKSKSLEVLNLSSTKLSPDAVVQLTQIPTLRRIVVGTLPWENELKTYIKKTFASEHPKVTLVWSDEFTSDHSVAMPAFQWKGEGLVAHECPIATLARETF